MGIRPEKNSIFLEYSYNIIQEIIKKNVEKKVRRYEVLTKMSAGISIASAYKKNDGCVLKRPVRRQRDIIVVAQ